MSIRSRKVLPELELHGAITFTAHWTVRSLKCHRVGDNFPKIHVTDEGVVSSLSGYGKLGMIEGRVVGRDDELFRAVELEQQQPDSYGQVINVDPCELDFNELKHFEALHVFEPNARAVLDDTKKNRTREECQERSQWMLALIRHTENHSMSSASRSSLHWAFARLQHLSFVKSKYKFERRFRRIYRSLGYGYKPVWPFVTWAATTFCIVLFIVLVPGVQFDKTPDPSIVEWRVWLREFGSTLLSPLTIFRIGEDDIGLSTKPHELRSVIKLFVGIPFAFLVVSLRNYFRSPAEGKG